MGLIYNLRRVSTATTGTGTITLGSAVSGYKAFSDTPALADQSVVSYAIADGAASEVGWGVYTVSGTTLTRNVIESTNSNNAISLSGSAQVFLTPNAGDLQGHTAYPNRFRNGTMDIWQRGTAAITVTTSGAYVADGWIVLPTGASVTAQQAAGRLLTSYNLKVTGAASVTDVIVKQRIESMMAAAFTSQQVTVQAWIYNGTGGSITPTLTVKHPTAADNYTSTATDVSAVNLQACANGAWTQVAYTFTASSSSAYGIEVAFDFGNNFSTNGKYIQITELDIRTTPGMASGLVYSPPAGMLRPIVEEFLINQRYLVCLNTSALSYGKFAWARANSTTIAYGPLVGINTPLRAAPTVMKIGNLVLQGASQALSSLAVDGYDGNGSLSIAWTVAGGLTSGNFYSVEGNNDSTSRIIVTAEL